MPITTTPSNGPQGEFSTYTPIYSQTLSATTSSITFSNIPTTFTDLVLVVTGIGTTGTTFPWMRFNGLSTNIYSDTQVYGISSGTGTGRRNAQSRGYIAEQVEMGTTQIASTEVHILDYSNEATFKTYLARNNNGAGSGTYVGTEAIAGLAQLTAAITSITIGTASGGTDYNFASGSSFTLYGIKAAPPAPKATGGDIVVTDGRYWYHAFTRTGVFTPLTSLSCDYIVVGGGGSGGYGRGGGGGAGGLRSATGVTISTATTATIGAGGTNTSSSATNGSNSSFSTTTSAGGGFGAGLTPGYYGASGGSGGGDSGFTTGTNNNYGSGNTPTTSPSQGNRGGAGYYDPTTHGRLGGGGGGAGAVGSDASSSTPGNGGAGSNTFATWANLTATGYDGYFAGGGGGGRGNSSAGIGVGGAGGAGTGGADTLYNSTNAAANTGSGGGGGGGIGGFGGSGVVIVRYLG